MAAALINGKPGDMVAIQDRGFQYGDGVFETMPVYQGEVLWFHQHYQRLQQGCQALKITIPEEELLLHEVRQLIENRERAIIKIIVTRGKSTRGYKAEPNALPTRVVTCTEWNNPSILNIKSGIRLKLCETPVSRHPVLGSIKHLNRLENILARQEWKDNEYDEGVMCDASGNVIEGIMSNIFIYKDNKLITPRITSAGVKGIMRNWILEQEDTWAVEENEGMTITDVMAADEVFMCNSLIGLWPVREFNDVQYQPGAVFHALYQKLSAVYPVLS